MKTILWFLAFVSLCACHSEDKKTVFHETYTGPLLELDSVNTLLSDSAKMKMRIMAPKQFEFVNGDRTFPNGLKIVFYKGNGKQDAVLTSNSGKYNKLKDLFTATGKVIIQNEAEKKKLTTEELNWSPKDKKVFTNMFVVIQTPTEVIKGDTLEAPQDFSSYKIRKVRGIFSVNQ